MRDNLRWYRAIRDALTQGYPSQPTGRVARHLTTGQGVSRASVSGQQSGNSRGGLSLVSHDDDSHVRRALARLIRSLGCRSKPSRPPASS